MDFLIMDFEEKYIQGLEDNNVYYYDTLKKMETFLNRFGYIK